MDTVRADHVAAGGTASITPSIDAIAEGGVAFERFFAAANYTLPSHMTLFTGLDPAEHGVYRATTALAPEARTLAEVLSAAGYRTQAFHEGGYVAPRFGFSRGFDDYRGFDPLELLRERSGLVLDWIRAAGDTPYFLFIHTYNAHAPYGGYARYRSAAPERGLLSDAQIAQLRTRWKKHPVQGAKPPPRIRAACTLYNLLAESWKDVLGCGEPSYMSWTSSPHFAADLEAMKAGYAARIREIDAFVGSLRDTLQDLGQWNDTLLIVTADHGEAFFEQHGQLHDFLPWEEVLRVPLVVSWPERLAAVSGERIDGLAGHADLMPTILALARVPAPDQGHGIDLSPVILGAGSLPEDRTLFPAVLRAAHLPPHPMRRVVLKGTLQYVEGDAEFGDSEGLLLDLSRPTRTNLREQRPEDTSELRSALQHYVARLVPVAPIDFRTGQRWQSDTAPGDRALDERSRKRLRALGYLQ